MKKLGEILQEERQAQNIKIEDVAQILLTKKEVVEALERGDWSRLPEPTYVKGFIKSYANLLGIDPIRLIALYRAEYDERKFPQKSLLGIKEKKWLLSPRKVSPVLLAIVIVSFLVYLILQYTLILEAPELKIYSPPKDSTTTARVIEISGQTDSDASVSISGILVAVDVSGKFYYQLPLKVGKNTIEIIASRRLSPKTREIRTIRLSP